MYDFGAILGSATRFTDPVTNNHVYFLDKSESVRNLWTPGLWVPPYLRAATAAMGPPSIGRLEGATFDPAQWKPNYPNPAFSNMRPDDAFWGARLVSRFSDAMIEAIAARAGYDDPRATAFLAARLIARRDRIAEVWLNGVNPIVDPALSAAGTLTFSNAAVDAGAASPATAYVIAWGRLDNGSGAIDPVGKEVRTRHPTATAPTDLLANATYIAVTIRSEHPDHEAWSIPVRAYFRRDGAGWRTVGLFRGE
jgi:hypothetical protein